ncbi:unnamed protein product [Porites lobata]|uniref:OTU domain-containing protein n=1 Tax=Porites lobata TaxID=104759 RepID=A0ABN8SBZ4_9CNID|nr:unnamed protein product [Porites lobata]
MEDDDNESDAGGPVIPILQSTSSTAQTSSTPTQTLSTPSTPAQTPSRSTPTQFTSTPAQSSFTFAQFTTPAQFMSSTPFPSAPLSNNDVDIIVNADKARDILGCMIKLPWDVNKNLSSHIAAHLPLMQLPKFLTSEEQRRLPERFSTYVPPYINDMGLEPFYTSGDGNCFYNSLAVIMDQGEESSEVYRLGSALFGLAHYEHIVQVNEDRLSHKDNALQWAACVSLSVHETGRLQDASVHKIVAEIVKRQVISALTNFTDIGILQVSFAAGFLKVPIQEHCTLPGAAFYNTLENPPCCFP